jgi:hypothetical protein
MTFEINFITNCNNAFAANPFTFNSVGEEQQIQRPDPIPEADPNDFLDEDGGENHVSAQPRNEDEDMEKLQRRQKVTRDLFLANPLQMRSEVKSSLDETEKTIVTKSPEQQAQQRAEQSRAVAFFRQVTLYKRV